MQRLNLWPEDKTVLWRFLSPQLLANLKYSGYNKDDNFIQSIGAFLG